MPRFQIFFLFILLSLHSFSQSNLVSLVNPFIGTGGHGHTFPGPVLPFGMVQAGPDTRIDGSWDGCSGYHYSDSIIYGFSHTHLSGTGCSDYGDILLMPIIRNQNKMAKEETNPNQYASTFNHKNETASPGYYSVLLDKHRIKSELSVSNRTARHLYTFPRNGKPALVLDLNHRDLLLSGMIRQVNDSTFEGVRQSKAWASNQRVYFRITFSRKVIRYTFCGTLPDTIYSREVEGGQLKALFEFAPSTQPLEVSVSLSGVYFTGAEANMLAESHQETFNTIRKKAADIWEQELRKIEVKGGTLTQRRIFYTALYHCFIHPSTSSDVDQRFCGRDFKIYRKQDRITHPDATYYTVFSLWDTFRALHPLFNLVQRERNLDFIRTFIEQERQSGRMPMWELSSNETNCMIGYHSISILADAYAKGIRGFDELQAWKACQNTIRNHGLGLDEFRNQHYLGVEDESECVSKTLEYAYDHWCLNQFASMAKIPVNQRDLLHNNFPPGQEWQLIFNKEKGFPQPRANGGWFTPFVPAEVNNYFTEANAWQYSAFVPHDIPGLIAANGGIGEFEKHLDSLFQVSSEIVGRNQADITGMIGQYAHGNEPSHHMAYLYNFTGSPVKTRKLLRQIMEEMYHDTPDGLSGNEDCGQMSAWYVLSAVGFYPVTPGIASYQMGYPLFDEVIIHANEKESATIRYHRHGLDYEYQVNDGDWLQLLELPHSKLFPKHLTDERSYQGATNFLSAPIFESEGKIFKHTAQIKIHIQGNSTPIFYSLKEPGSQINYADSIRYNLPIILDKSTDIIAWTNSETGGRITALGGFRKLNKDWTISLSSKFHPQYTADGEKGLIDGLYGDTEWRKGGWQGYQGQDFGALIDLGKKTEIREINTRYLQDQRAWIFLPREVIYAYSNDGIHFHELQIFQKKEIKENDSVIVETFTTHLSKPVKARFIRVGAKKSGKLPVWHPGAGEDSYIFIDEIDIK